MPSSRSSTRKVRFEIDSKQKEMFLLEMKYIPKSQVLEDLEYYFEYSLGDSFKKMSKAAKSTKLNAVFKQLLQKK